MELWFLGQGHHDHLEKEFTEILTESQGQWKRLDFQLCALLWQSMEPNILETLRSFKTCYYFWKKAPKIYANDIQRLYDAADKLTSYKQTDHDMTTCVAQIQSAIEELKMLLDADLVEEMKRKHGNLYMVLALRAMNPDFDHIRDQILTGQKVPSTDSLMTRLLHVPTPRKTGNSLEHVESSAMVSTRGRL